MQLSVLHPVHHQQCTALVQDAERAISHSASRQRCQAARFSAEAVHALLLHADTRR